MSVNPVLGYESEIRDLLAQHEVLVLKGPTGSGKSTEVGPMLLRGGYRRVIVTQPRRLPAWSIATWVAKQMKVKLGTLVGWKTGEGGNIGEKTRLQYVTDGLEVRRFIHGHSVRGADEVLVIDEVHERSTSIDKLLALSRDAKLRGEKFKLVLMSATLDPQRLADYFNTPAIVDVPGRVFPIETQEAGESVMADAIELANAGKNVLVFVATQAETHKTASAIKRSGVDAEVFPLHAGMEPEEQQEIFGSYSRPVIVVSTNVAETSLTIPYINAVVDGGMEMREECFRGIKGLFRREISRASQKQRAGRAGRTGPGVVRHHGSEEREEYTPSQILRTPLSETVLDLASDGLSFDSLQFLDHPKVQDIEDARLSLNALGFLDTEGKITPMGREAVKYPVECHVDRMIIEARKRGCVAEILELAALMQVEGIRDNRAQDPEAWGRLVAGESESDLFAHHLAYRKVKGLSRQARRDAGVMAKKVDEVGRIVKKLWDVIDQRDLPKQIPQAPRIEILKCICAGMVDHLFHRESGGYYRDVDRGTSNWKLASESSLWVTPPEWLVGMPFYAGRNNLVQMATAIDPAWMLEVAPHLCTREPGAVAYDAQKDWVERSVSVKFRGYEIARESENVSPEEATQVFSTWLVSQMRYGYGGQDARAEELVKVRQQLEAARQVNYRAGREAILLPSDARLAERFAEVLGNPRCVGDVKDWKVLNVIGEELAAKVAVMHPATVEAAGQVFQVDYSADTAQIQVDENTWTKLPASGVYLPDGRKIAVVFMVGGKLYGPTTDVGYMQQLAAGQLVTEAIQQWTAPELAVPARAELRKQFPAIVRVEVCRNVLTGEPVMMFGALHLDAAGPFAWCWSQDEREQESVRREAERAAKVRGGLGSDEEGGGSSGLTLWGHKL